VTQSGHAEQGAGCVQEPRFSSSFLHLPRLAHHGTKHELSDLSIHQICKDCECWWKRLAGSRVASNKMQISAPAFTTLALICHGCGTRKRPGRIPGLRHFG